MILSYVAFLAYLALGLLVALGASIAILRDVTGGLEPDPLGEVAAATSLGFVLGLLWPVTLFVCAASLAVRSLYRLVEDG